MNKDEKPRLVTLSYNAAYAAYMASYVGIFAAVSFLAGTPFSMGAAGVSVGINWYFAEKTGARLSRSYVRLHWLNAEQGAKDAQYKELSQMISRLSTKAGLREKPLLYLDDDNGDCKGIAVAGENPTILVAYTPLLERLNPEETTAIIGHEITHLAAGHFRLQMATNALVSLPIAETQWHFAASLFSGRPSYIFGAVLSSIAVTLVVEAIHTNSRSG